MKAVLTITDAAYYTGLRERDLMDLIDAQKIPYRKRGKKVLFLIRELDAWLDTLPGLTMEQLTNHPARIPATPSENLRHDRLPQDTKQPSAALQRGRPRRIRVVGDGDGS
jgi:excisionase family DNA binding protein